MYASADGILFGTDVGKVVGAEEEAESPENQE
jgi:hypothetical protein